MRECLYFLSLLYNQLPYNGQINQRRDLSAQLFLLADREIKRKEIEVYKFEVSNIDITFLIKREKEKLQWFNMNFND
jgi:hypothetical protein